MNHKAGIEGLLFLVGEEGASLKEISKIFEMKIVEVKRTIEELKSDLESDDRGLSIIEYNGKLKFTTKQQYFDFYTKLVEEKKKRGLSQAALETLAIIAYNQPFTRSEIENIRGIAADGMIYKLKNLEFIKESGRSEKPGKPMMYEVTGKFFDVFKLKSLKELPPLTKLSLDKESDLFGSEEFETIIEDNIEEKDNPSLEDVNQED